MPPSNGVSKAFYRLSADRQPLGCITNTNKQHPGKTVYLRQGANTHQKVRTKMYFENSAPAVGCTRNGKRIWGNPKIRKMSGRKFHTATRSHFNGLTGRWEYRAVKAKTILRTR